MKKLIHVISTAILAVVFCNAWAAEPGAKDKSENMDKSEMQHGAQSGEGEGMKMDKEHMDRMHKHMEEMHKSNDDSETKHNGVMCDMKNDAQCEAKKMKEKNTPAMDKAKSPPTKADDHSAHH